jgi:hypothetical protein
MANMEPSKENRANAVSFTAVSVPNSCFVATSNKVILVDQPPFRSSPGNQLHDSGSNGLTYRLLFSESTR